MKLSFLPAPSHVGRVLWQTLKRFENMERRKEAAALTYTTLFALVPVITVSYSILSAIPALQEWGQEANQQLLGYVLPQGSEVITDYLQQFSEQARKLTFVGIAALFVTCILLLQTVEQQFNRIWNVESSRSKIQTFFRYWAVLSLGPLLFGAAAATSSVLASMPLWESTPGAAITFFASLIPWALTTAAVTVLYLMVPNTKVPVVHALIAALIVASAFELGKFLFSGALGLFPSYQLIYGAFAAVPLFLLWIYVSWMLLLLGAELSYGLSHYRRPGSGRFPVEDRLRLASLLVSARDEDSQNSELAIRRQLGDIDAGRVTNLLQEFRRKGWIVSTDNGRWAWVRNPESLSVGDFFAGQTLKHLRRANAGENSKLVKLQEWQQEFGSTFSEKLDKPLSSLLD
ncbi:MAG: YihY family inner membrane protein [Thalassolituus sp.]